MENKTTTELLDLLYKIENSEEDKQDWNKYDEILKELKNKEPFKRILGESEYPNDYLTIEEQVKELVEDVKLLKRHKHDDKTNDVLIRI